MGACDSRLRIEERQADPFQSTHDPFQQIALLRVDGNALLLHFLHLIHRRKHTSMKRINSQRACRLFPCQEKKSIHLSLTYDVVCVLQQRTDASQNALVIALVLH